MLRFLSLLCFLFSYLSILGQINQTLNREKDSIARIALFSSDTAAIKYYNDIGRKFMNLSPDTSIKYLNKALEKAKYIETTSDQIRTLNYIGIAFRNKSEFTRAFNYYMQALRISESSKDTVQLGYSLINLGNIFLYQTNYNGALDFFKRAMLTAELLNDKRLIAYCYANLGRSYSNLGSYRLAEDYYVRAIEIRNELGDEQGVTATEVDLAELYRLQGQLKKSLEYYLMVLPGIQASDNMGALTYSLNNISLIYKEMDDLVKAEQYALRGLKIAKEMGSKNDIRKATENLSDIFYTNKNYKKAYEYHVQYSALKDSLFSEENIRTIEEIKTQYEREQQEAQNDFLRKQDSLNKAIIKRQQTIIILVIVGSVLILIAAVILLRAYRIVKTLSNKIKKQKDEIEKDKDTIEKQSRRLEELDMAKSRFFANISHDLRSPLTLILGNIERIVSDDDNYFTMSSQENLDIVYKNSKRLLYLTDEINELTKLEEGKLKLNLKYVKLLPYLKTLVKMFQSSAESKRIDLTLHASIDDNTILKIDPDQIDKVVFNLISNALKYTRENDRIKVNLYDKKDTVCIAIADSGSGIPSENLPYIFDRYYQSENDLRQLHKGLGIGLALVKEIVQLHQGKIFAESEEGKGTTFYVEFLKETNQIEEAIIPTSSDYIKEKSSAWAGLEIATKSKPSIKALNKADCSTKILLVEDHPEVRNYIRQIIEDHYIILEAEHGVEALKILNRETVDLIITDLMMPWMDGFELLDKVQQDDKLKHIPILVVSARTSQKDRENILFRGINDFLQKPFDQKEFLLRIRNLLNKETSRDNLILSNTEKFDDLESDLIKKVEHMVLEKINDSNLGVMHLADAMAASERQVYRMIKKLTGMTPSEYIKEIRWQYVDQLIKSKKVKNPSEAARSIGMKNVTRFKQQYEKRFGKKPAEPV